MNSFNNCIAQMLYRVVYTKPSCGFMASVEIVDSEPYLPNILKRKLVLDIGPLSFPDDCWKERKATVFTHKARGKDYYGARIVITRLRNLRGRNYVTLRGEATFRRMENQNVIQQEQGDCIVLFFPRKEDKKET